VPPRAHKFVNHVPRAILHAGKKAGCHFPVWARCTVGGPSKSATNLGSLPEINRRRAEKDVLSLAIAAPDRVHTGKKPTADNTAAKRKLSNKTLDYRCSLLNNRILEAPIEVRVHALPPHQEPKGTGR
jgi:hypothetical protein